jgi:hypothetical protein
MFHENLVLMSNLFQFNFFSDGKNNNTCADNEFLCGSTLRKNKKCIPYDKVCDKEEDCPDGNLFSMEFLFCCTCMCCISFQLNFYVIIIFIFEF